MFAKRHDLLFPVSYRNRTPPHLYTQICTYVDVYMKWKKDSYYDSIEHIHKSIDLKRIVSLKNCISQDPDGCIPISDVSKRGVELEIPVKVAQFLRQYPSIFEEFKGPQHNLPWFRLTQEATEIDMEEKRVYEESRGAIVERLKKLILMSRGKALPLKIIQGMLWYLGLPEDFLHNQEQKFTEPFKFVEMEDGLKGLAVDYEGEILSVLEKNALKKGLLCDGSKVIEFPLFQSKGLRLRRKIENWLEEFQNLPYVSPYEDISCLSPDSDVAEKRLVGVLHELLSIFVEHSAERKKLFCLKKHLGLPQKVHKAFERHPHIFYLSLKNNTCTAILKEPYNDKKAIEKHPLLAVRKKYIRLMKESEYMLRNRRMNNRFDGGSQKKDLDLDYVEDEEMTGIEKELPL